MLFEVLARRRPFEGPPFAVLERKQHEAAPELLSVAPAAPPDLAELCHRLLEREPARRRGPFAIVERSEDPPPAVAQLPARVRLAARELELERLTAERRAALGGAHRVLIVRGESGMGKTTLVREFVSRVRQDGSATLVLSGRCYPRESIPYRAMDEVMDQLGAFWKALPEGPASYLVPREPEFLLRAFPTLGRVRALDDGTAHGITSDWQDAAFRSFAACREVYQRLARLRPVIITLDDVQWIDADSTRLLEFLGASHEAPPLLLVLATRPALGNDAADGERRLMALGSTLDLAPLSDVDMTRLIETVVGPASQHELSDLVRAAAGNPFFGLRLAHCAKTAPAQARLGLSGALSAQLSNHSALARAMLELMSIAAAPLSARSIAGTLAADLDSVHLELGVLEEDQLVNCAESLGESAFELQHDRIRQLVSGLLTPERSRALHRCLALHYEAHTSDHPERCARHFAAAGDPLQAAAHARRAAELALSRLSFDRAAEYYRLCLQLAPLPLVAERQLQACLANALRLSGQGLAAAEEYLASARDVEAGDALIREQHAAEELLRAGYPQRGLEVLDRALAKAGLGYEPSPARRALRRVTSRLGRRQRGSEAPRPLPELAVRIDLCAAAADCLAFCKPAYTRHYQTLHLRLTEQLDDAGRRCRALGAEAVYGALGGRPSEAARQAMREAQKLASLAGDDRTLGALAHYQAMVAYYQGDWHQAFDHSVMAERRLVRSRSGTQWEIDNARLYTTAALQIQGRLRNLSRRRERWLEQALSQRNMFAQTILRAGPARFVRLARDEAKALRDDLREVMSFWSASELSIPRFWELEALTDLDLYERRGGAAFARFRALSTGRKSIPLLVQVTRVKLAHALGRAAIAAAIEGADTRELLELATARAQMLEQEDATWSHALGTMLRAGIAAVRRQHDECRQLLTFAERQLLDADMALDAWAVRHWLGRLLAGSDGQQRCERASRWFTARGVRDIQSLVEMRAPGASLY